jgi:hypothetical protein
MVIVDKTNEAIVARIIIINMMRYFVLLRIL